MTAGVWDAAERTVVSVPDVLLKLKQFDSLIDVRTEDEFEIDHLPGAINLPVLTNTERVEVGTMDRQQSSFEARRRGAAYVSRNIAHHLETRFDSMPKSWRPLVYCWRGGNRSGAMTHILRCVGWQARQLEGGYRAYRRQVVADLATQPVYLSLRVVCGTTGSGKSRLLQELCAQGAQVLDLEALAHHRGSVLGGLPAQRQPSQKMFETRLWSALHSFDPERIVFVESESRKIGELRVPDALLKLMRASECVRLEVPLRARIRLLRGEYEHFESDRDLLDAQLDCLSALHGRQKIERWKALARADNWDDVVEQLLVEHYDPAYLKSIDRNFERAADANIMRIESDAIEDYQAAARKLVTLVS
ncbi:MAG TPA: tRNA 2-selenouridine(34) synthase MnmH [Burkholderiaceae bacterium]|nr:tRNA 2-selenouridine(34) synthase MnmH [Burkholderiaceae bacterium]